MAPLDLQRAFVEAIIVGNENNFQALLPQLDPWANDGEAAEVAIEHHRLFAIDALNQSLANGKRASNLMDRAVVRAASLENREGLDRLTTGPYQAIRLACALTCAAKEGNTKAVDVLLDEGANPTQGAGGSDFALGEALEHHHLSLARRLLPLSDTWKHSETVLRRAIAGDRVDGVDMVLSVCDPNAIAAVLPVTARHGNPLILARLIQEARRFPLMPVQDALNLALSAAATYGQEACLDLLLPLCDPKRDGNRALCDAVASGHEQCGRKLIPHSDIEQIKKGWLATRPQKWDRVDRLACWAPLDVCEAWCAQHANRLPAAKARLRAGKAMAEPADLGGEARRRLRP